MGGGRKVGGCRQVKATVQTNNSAVPSVNDLGWYNSQGRPGLPLESV